jgi:uncharacterized membrane protein YqiK
MSFTPSQIVIGLVALGLVFVVTTALGAMSRFFRRCGADEALVRTGTGGNKVVIGGGVMVYPILHQLMRVSLRSVKLSVEREGKNALVTADKIKANVTTELYIKVEPLAEDVLAAARSFGERNLERRGDRRSHRRQAHRRAPQRGGQSDVHEPALQAQGVRRDDPGDPERGAEEERPHARERVDHVALDGAR